MAAFLRLGHLLKIGLIDVDSKIPNLALMKISAYHKAQGHHVELTSPLFASQFDQVYVSKIFKDSHLPMLPDNAIIGGSGYDLSVKLPPGIESQYPDYSLYNCDYAMGFTLRGCIRKCSFCVVPEKEGKPQRVGDINSFWRGQKQLMLLDNNLTADPAHFSMVCTQLAENAIETDFSQGLDIRLITPEMSRLLAKVKLWKQIHFAFDDIKSWKQVRDGIKMLDANGVKRYKLMFYVLIGYNSTPHEDMARIRLLRKWKVDPYVMPFNKDIQYQKDLARWVNHKAVFKSTSFKNYR